MPLPDISKMDRADVEIELAAPWRGPDAEKHPYRDRTSPLHMLALQRNQALLERRNELRGYSQDIERQIRLTPMSRVKRLLELHGQLGAEADTQLMRALKDRVDGRL
jgi:hypothetical protein